HTRFSRDWSSDVCSSDLVRTAKTSVEFHLAPPLHAPRQAYHLDRDSTAACHCPLAQHRRFRRTLTGATPDIVPGNSNAPRTEKYGGKAGMAFAATGSIIAPSPFRTCPCRFHVSCCSCYW